MNRVFVDTSAILALLDPTDLCHERAKSAFHRLSMTSARMFTTSYVLLEMYALASRRMGLEAVRALREDFVPLLEVVWVDEALYEHGLDLMLERNVRNLSLVDAVSFVVVRMRRLEAVFAFDAHFDAEGFPMVT